MRTSAYHSQSNGICERFNQTPLSIHLLKLYPKVSRYLGICTWALQLSLTISQFTQAPASRTSSWHSAQKRISLLISFSAFLRLQWKISKSQVEPRVHPYSTCKVFFIRSHAFASVRENLHFVHQREKIDTILALREYSSQEIKFELDNNLG